MIINSSLHNVPRSKVQNSDWSMTVFSSMYVVIHTQTFLLIRRNSTETDNLVVQSRVFQGRVCVIFSQTSARFVYLVDTLDQTKFRRVWGLKYFWEDSGSWFRIYLTLSLEKILKSIFQMSQLLWYFPMNDDVSFF